MSFRETLKSVFDNDYCGTEEFLARVIVPVFGEDDVDVFDVEEANPTRADEETLKKANILEIYRVATVDRVGTDPIEVFDVTLGDNINISRSRVGIQRIIRSSLFPYTHAFIIFHNKILSGTEWRFSYIYKEDKNANTTDAKRYTYLFGRDIHARTAIDRFCKLAESSKDNKALLDAFNVEALSNDFFEEYRAQYAKFVKYITGKEYIKENGRYVEKVTGKPNKELYEIFGCDDKAIRDYVKKMMGRITFLHFLQRKRWLRHDVNYMLKLFKKSKYKDDYLDKVLEPLFFGILNTKPEDRLSLFKASGWDLELLDEWKNIPYLNGGLFEQDEVDKYRSVFPAEYFDSLLTFFSEYNFTVDENDPDDAEVGVDPEMLGKIFENLLEDNKDKGAFYTPKEIVRYMCRESLIAYLLEKTGIKGPEIRDFVTSPYEKEEQMEWDDKEKILTALEEVKICDPAIGSGAFPMGLLNELVRCEEAIVLGQEKNKGRAELKKAIIKNNIYGVDIEKGAVDIARLRFWLSLVVDEEEPSPLPNLDYKIMQGDSLLESYEGIDLSHFLDGKDGTLNFGEATRQQLKEKLDNYYSCEEHTEKKQLQNDINDLVHQQILDSGFTLNGFDLIDVSANTHFFLWHTWFSDVFTGRDNEEYTPGFDIVIGNPPYIDSETMTRVMPQTRARYASLFSAARGNWDIYIIFYEQGMKLLNSKGRLSYITPNKWLSIGYGKALRRQYFNSINSLCDCQRIKVFEAGNEPTICSLSNTENGIDTIIVSRYETDYTHHVLQSIPKSKLTADDLGVLLSEHIDLLMKIKGQSRHISDYIDSENPFSTSEAYGLIPLVEDKPFVAGENYKLINTGTIDPYISLWGLCRTSYLNGKYKYPTINRKQFGRSFPRRARQAEAPKIIISGMRYFEAFLDEKGDYIAGKSTIILLNPVDRKYFKVLLGILNSKLISFYLKQSFSTLGIGGGINFSNDMVAAIPIPLLEDSGLVEQIDSWVNVILNITRSNPDKADFSVFQDYSRALYEIEKRVSRMYHLSLDEVRVIDNATTISENDLS